jgi:hypothetical protein
MNLTWTKQIGPTQATLSSKTKATVEILKACRNETYDYLK